MQRNKSMYDRSTPAITAEPPVWPRGHRCQSAQIASLETRINGQQRRIADQERFITALKKELHAIRETITLMGAPLKPGTLDRPARKGTF